MTLPGGFSGGVWGDGSADERSGAWAARGAAGFGSSAVDERGYLEAWGKPIAFYSDKHGVYRVNHAGALGGDGMTQFGRAVHALNIDIICANSSPAKGRVERAHKTVAGPAG